jgi:hypothetical protein
MKKNIVEKNAFMNPSLANAPTTLPVIPPKIAPRKTAIMPPIIATMTVSKIAATNLFQKPAYTGWSFVSRRSAPQLRHCSRYSGLYSPQF